MFQDWKSKLNMDYFLSYENCLNRLRKEYQEHGQLIIAYDFDNTIFNFHKDKDRTFNNVIELLQKCKEKDIGKFICFTASKEERFPFIKNYLDMNNIPCDTINKGIEGLPNGNIKPYYNILLDDRAGLLTAYNLLKDLLGE